MEIKTLQLGYLSKNSYLLSSEKGAVVIDPGYKSDEVTSFLNDNKDKERLIFLTHNHFDHIGAALELSRNTNTKIAIGLYDNKGLSNPEINLSLQFGSITEPFSADVLLKDSQILEVGDLKFKIIHTPGHTVGGICLLIDKFIFVGDTLFYESIGRTDFPGGSFDEIKKSILKLYDLDENLTVLSGHGPETTINHEKLFNPYVGNRI